MHAARCGDELVGRDAPEVEAGRRKRHRKVDEPYVNPAQNSGDFPIFEIHLDAAKVHEFRHLPEHDGGNGPSLPSEQRLLVRPELAAQRVDQDSGVKIQHRRSSVRPCS